MSPPPRRPLSRRIMLVLFVLILVPIAGWSLLGRMLETPSLLTNPEDAARVDALLADLRQQLALVLVASFAALGGALLYLRRTVLDPLAHLARRAREADEGWSPPPQSARADEIGDLARALDGSISALRQRAEGAVQLTANLSHELRTPLAAIRGAAELMEEQDVDPADRRRFVGHICTESERLERLVSGLLDMHRTDRDGPARERGRADLAAILPAVLERARPLLSRKGVEAALELPDGPLPAAIASERAQRILLGLLENAIKFSPGGTTITVAARGEPAGVRISVSDQGPGVPPELREAIFDRYFTAAREGGAAARGTGLGLAIVKSLVDGAGGTIAVDDAPEGGACFHFVLPAPPATPS